MYFERGARIFQIGDFSGLSIFHALDLIDKSLGENSSLNLILKKQVMGENRTLGASCHNALVARLSGISVCLGLLLLAFSLLLLLVWLDFEIIVGKHELHLCVQVFGKLKILLRLCFTLWLSGALLRTLFHCRSCSHWLVNEQAHLDVPALRQLFTLALQFCKTRLFFDLVSLA